MEVTDLSQAAQYLPTCVPMKQINSR